MNWILLVILLIVNIPIFLMLGKFFFGGWDEFGEAVCYWFKPDIWSLFQGEHWDDMWAELKLGLFVLCCVRACLR